MEFDDPAVTTQSVPTASHELWLYKTAKKMWPTVHLVHTFLARILKQFAITF
jgi:hypothetical protein